MATTGRGKPGMPPRGDRAAFTVRIPIAQNAVYEERAAALGIPIGSWVVLKLAEAEGLPTPDYIVDEIKRAESRRAHQAEQEELPLARSA